MKDRLTCAIPGMMKPYELEENFRVGRQPRELDLDEIKKLMECVGEGRCLRRL